MTSATISHESAATAEQAAKHSVLFVDDESQVLSGLRRMLYGKHPDWVLDFAESGAEALKKMAAHPVDVVVTDMRMPQMDGATLLDEVRRRYPKTVRIILSGYSGQEAIYRTIGPAHQYFAKPCNGETLVHAIARALALRKLIHSDRLLRLTGRAKTVPALPKTLTRLLEEIQSPSASAAGVAKIIEADIGLTAQLLKLTNSAYFSFSQPIASPMQAVRLLGLETVRALALMAGVFEEFVKTGIDLSSIELLERRCFGIGAAAKEIATSLRFSAEMVERAQCAGMLSHVGSILLRANWPDATENVVRSIDREGGSIVDWEHKVFGANHAEIGAYLLGLWGFSDEVVEAVAYHHRPSESRCMGAKNVGLLACLHIAQHLVKPSPEDPAEQEKWLNGLDRAYLDRFALSARISEWTALCKKYVEGGRS